MGRHRERNRQKGELDRHQGKTTQKGDGQEREGSGGGRHNKKKDVKA